MNVSIIICTRDRAQELHKTLEALKLLCVPVGYRTELLIVDNASCDDTAAVVRQAQIPDISVRYIYEPKKGQCFARNCGLLEGRGDIFLFTDDDVRPPENWIEGMCSPILEGRGHAVAGGVHLAPHLKRTWMTPHLENCLACTNWIDVATPSAFVGANMAFSRDVLHSVPSFDTELGPGALGFYDEILFAWQIKKAGCNIVSACNISVEHHCQVARLSRESFITTFWKYGQSLAYISYHWDHSSLSDIKRKLFYTKMKLMYLYITHPYNAKRTEGIAGWEFYNVQELGFYTQYLLERKRPRKYDKQGLKKLYL